MHGLSELKEYRERQKPRLSQAGLAAKLGVTRTTVARWEIGERRPAQRFIPKLVKLTGIPVAAIVGVR